MENITQLYTVVEQELRKIKEIKAEYEQKSRTAARESREEKSRTNEDYLARKKELEEQISRAENYRDIAACHTSFRRAGHENETPDFSRFFVLYTSVEEDSAEDSAAAELWSRANGALTYLHRSLDQLSDELQRRLASADLNGQDESARAGEKLRGAYEQFFRLPVLRRLADAIKVQTEDYFISQSVSYDLTPPDENSEMLKFGMIQKPLQLDPEYMPAARKLFGVYYDASTQSIRMPFGFRTDRGVKISLTYPGEMLERVQRILIGFLFNVLRHYKPISSRVYYLDSLTYNPEHLGPMKYFAGPDNMICFPRTEKETDLALAALMASNGADAADRENRILIVRDFPGNFSSDAREKILNICSNAAFYQITVLFAGEEEKAERQSSAEKAAMNGALPIFARDGYFRIQHRQETLYFSWFAAPGMLSEQMIRRFQQAFRPVRLGSAYPDRVDLTRLPVLKKGNKKIRVPIGVDESDRLTWLDMNDVNFAAYLMGASGSGKSTLLHTIITGLIRNYHPDDVELWLADFKMGEFAQYMAPRPPHVKYVLMDDSRELVYDFLNLLTRELTRRKQFFSQHSDYKKVEDVPDSYRMPLIVVIIDEFSLMSQAISDEQDYRLLLQNLLSGGRALGFRFIFSSQDYSHGITGLTEMAKSQIQSRLAMKNTSGEIRETLNLTSGNMTDRLRTWTENLPPHMVISASTENGKKAVTRSQVLYFPREPGKGTYELQRQMILQIRENMKKVPASEFDGEDTGTYVDKKPFDADGNSLKCFAPEQFRKAAEDFERRHPEELFPGDLLVAVGEPRRLDRSYVFPVAEENRENLMLISGTDRLCSVSVIRSAIQSFVLQGGSVQIWTYRRNQLYGLYLSTHSESCTVLTEAGQIGSAIEELKEKITRHQQGRELVVLMGLDHIQEDFELLEPEEETRYQNFEQAIQTDTETAGKIEDIYDILGERFAEIEEEGIEQNKTQEEIDAEIEECIAQYMAENGGGAQSGTEETDTCEDASVPSAEPVHYDYSADLAYIVGHGPHCGYHFLLCAGSYPELRKSGLKTDWFRHKMSFRISSEDSSMLLGSLRAANLPEHVCLYESDQKYFTFRPFLHPGIGWNGWKMDDSGHAVKSESEE